MAAAKRFLLIDGHKNSVTFLAPSLSAHHNKSFVPRSRVCRGLSTSCGVSAPLSFRIATTKITKPQDPCVSREGEGKGSLVLYSVRKEKRLRPTYSYNWATTPTTMLRLQAEIMLHGFLSVLNPLEKAGIADFRQENKMVELHRGDVARSGVNLAPSDP